jgi:hypothetical protein
MSDEVIHIGEPPHGATCDVHAWPTEGMGKRLVKEMREKHGKGGVNACYECIVRARDSLRPVVTGPVDKNREAHERFSQESYKPRG